MSYHALTHDSTDPFPPDTSTASDPLQPCSTDTPVPTRITNNDIVASRPTQNNATTNPTSEPSQLLKRTQHDIVVGSSTLTNATALPSHHPTTPSPHRRRRRQRQRHNIAPTTVPIITPPRQSLREAQEDNMNRLIHKIGGLELLTDIEKNHLSPYGDHLQLDPAWPNPGE